MIYTNSTGGMELNIPLFILPSPRDLTVRIVGTTSSFNIISNSEYRFPRYIFIFQDDKLHETYSYDKMGVSIYVFEELYKNVMSKKNNALVVDTIEKNSIIRSRF